MCGITAIIRLNYTNDKKEIKSNTKSIAHRDPDSDGIFIKDNIGLEHRSLSIVFYIRNYIIKI